MIDIYTTYPSQQEAEKIGRLLLKKRLAACVNFFPIRSCYWWQGKIVKDKEVAMFIKTQQKHYQKIEEFIKKHHSYTIPCIVVLPVSRAFKPYQKWLYAETKQQR